jgi:TonB family protein
MSFRLIKSPFPRVLLRVSAVSLLSVAGAAVALAQASTPPQDQCKVDSQLKIIKFVSGAYSEEATKNSVEGRVTMCVTVNAEGKVTEVQRLSGPPELMQSSIDALKQWQFERPTKAPATTSVEMSYSLTKPCPGGGKGMDVGTVKVTIEPGHTVEGQTGDPLKIVGNISQQQPPYPDKARAQRRRGQLYLSISVNGNGDVVDSKIVMRLDELLDQTALEAVLTWKFKVSPPGGNTTVFPVTISFQIPCLDDPANK